MMKASRILAAAALGALVILSAGCKKHSWRPVAGETIRFRAVSESGPSSTKTVYSGEYYNTSVEHIDWVEGDKITIAYVSFTTGTDIVGLTDDYVVSGIRPFDRSQDASARSRADLTPANGNGLVWQDATYHGFFGTYPDLTGESDFEFRIDEGSHVFYKVPFHFPAEQYPVSSGASTLNLLNGDKINCVRFNPDMQYAYMTANADSFTTLDSPEVNLLFRTEFIAYEFSVDVADAGSLVVNSFSMTDAAGNLVGDFILRTRDDYETDERLGLDNLSPTVSFYFDDEKNPVTITQGTPIVFTVFTGIDWFRENTQLTITFSIVDKSGNTVNRSLKLQDASGNWISFDQWDGSDHKTQGIKHRIYGLEIPIELPIYGWFESPSDAGGYTNQDW